MNYQDFFSDIEDFRVEGRCLHLLSDILMLSLCAVLCGAEDYEDIENYGKHKEDFLREFLELPYGIPSHDTIDRVFRHINPTQFVHCLQRWSREILDYLSYYQLNIDGKVLRGTNPSGRKKGGICLINAWASEQGLFMGQLRSEAKSNEKTAIPELLAGLDLENALVSIDAIACQSSVTRQIKAQKGDYLLALKKNQKSLYEQVVTEIARVDADIVADVWEDFGSGRIEKRVCKVIHQLDFIDDLADWQGIASVIQVVAHRETKTKKQEETRYYLSSLAEDAHTFNRLIRNHWSIENQLHWHLDVSFREDQSRVRKDHGPENMALLRKTALQILKQVEDKQSIKSRRKMAGWDDEYLLNILKIADF